MKKYKFLDKVKFPSDIRKLKLSELKILSNEVREELIDAVSVTGGHLGAGLGVVELSVALHYVFDTPNDKLVWDVGHQAYGHKILTGRREVFHTNRKYKGTGLGRAISKGLTETMGGTLTFESKIGSGTTFYISLAAQEV